MHILVSKQSLMPMKEVITRKRNVIVIVDMIIIVNPFPLNDYQDFAGHREHSI